MSDFEPSHEPVDQEESILDWNVPGSLPDASALDKVFWGDAGQIESILIPVQPAPKPLAILEKLGPSPFERGSFPLIGFLATTFDKVSQFALERAGSALPPTMATVLPDSIDSLDD